MNKVILNNKKPSSFTSHWNGLISFEKKFNALFEAGDVPGLINFLEQFSSTYPLYRDLIKQAYNLTTKVGIASLANECARIYTETCTKLLTIGRSEFGLPTIFEFNHLNESDSELVDQAAFTKILLQLGVLPIKPVLSLANIENNPFLKAFSPYLEECFEIMSGDSNATIAISEVAKFSPYVPLFYKFSDSQYGHNSNFIIDCHADLVSKGVEHYPFSIKETTVEIGKNFLKPYGLSEKDEFVVFYLREEGYFGCNNSRERQVYPERFYQSVDYFLQQGLKVVRLGHSKMTPMPEQRGFIDLSNLERPYEVDIFLCGKAKLYFGSGSGPISLAKNFGVPCCEIGRIDYGGTTPNSLSQYLIFDDANTDTRCTFSFMDSIGLKSNFSLEPFLNRNLIPHFPNSTTNLTFAKEALEFINGGAISTENEKYSAQRTKFNILGEVSSSSLPLLE